VRRGSDWSDNPSLLTVYISYFIFLCQHALDKQEVAWVHLREAITVALVLGMHKEETYQSEAGERNIYSICKRKLFWELYMWER
jgi:hypothetical protein